MKMLKTFQRLTQSNASRTQEKPRHESDADAQAKLQSALRDALADSANLAVIDRYYTEFQAELAKGNCISVEAFVRHKKLHLDFIAEARKRGLNKKEMVDAHFADFKAVQAIDDAISPGSYFTKLEMVKTENRKRNIELAAQLTREETCPMLIESFVFYAELMSSFGREARVDDFERIAKRYFDANAENTNITLEAFKQFASESFKQSNHVVFPTLECDHPA